MGIISFIIGLAILVAILKILTFPIKLIVKFIFNSILGGIVLAIFAFFGIGIVVYWWTILLVGLLGIPGLIIAAIIAMFI